MEDLLRRFTPRLAYLCPSHQNPTGVVMGETRRRRLARLVEETGLPLVDDNALAELSLESEPPPPVAAFLTARGGRDGSSEAAPIVTLGSMSKVFWGGLRVGWLRAPEPIIARLARLKAVGDQGCSLVSQVIAVRLLDRIDEARAVRRAQGIERLAALRGLVDELLPGWTCNRPAGGHIAWLRLPRGDASELAQVALRHGVAVVPGSLASPDGGMREYLRMPFVAEPAVLGEGLRRLAGAWEVYAASLQGRDPGRILV
jgi:DNA-binding transcriptional MocR family regulator